ncbi:MAG: hypothetical protein QOG31_368 [Thermoplasmata archaeon]|nr:hypothetical protein [Thermoplasmata archaeon]
MRTTYRLLHLLAIAALLGAPAAGAATTQGAMTATGVAAHAGAVLDGPLVALWQQDAAPGATADPAFTLRADLLRVETDSAEVALPNPLNPVSLNPRTAPPALHRDATVRGTALAGGYRWTLLATDPSDPPRIAATSGCAQGHPAAQDAIVRQPLVNFQRGDAPRDLSRAVAWGCLDGARVAVTGNFTLSLWAWNATLESRGGRSDLHSGTAPAGPALRRQDEVYLFATGGTLTLPALAGQGALLYTGAGTRLSGGTLGLEGATGTLEAAGRATSLHGNAVAVEGDTALAVVGQGAGRPLAARLAGQARSVSVDGRDLALTATFPLAPMLPLAVALGGLGLLATAGEVRRGRLARGASWGGQSRLLSPPATWRERRAMGHWALARDAAFAGRLRRAQGHVQRALRWFPRSLDARLLDAALLVRRGDHPTALHALERLYADLGDGPERFEAAAMGGSSAMLAGRHAEAVAWLRRAAAVDPLAFTQEVRNPLYEGLRDEWVRTARSSFARAYLAC